MTSYYFGAFCALIATRAIDAIKADSGVWSHIRFWLVVGLLAAVMTRCCEPVPALAVGLL